MNVDKIGVGIWVFGIVPDRFLPTGYQPNIDLTEKIRMIGAVPGVSGVEVPFGPVLTNDNLDSIAALLSDNGLVISSLTVNVTSDRKWSVGSITNPDKRVRSEAIALVTDAMRAAEYLNVDTLNLWMGQEGFDYPFEVDYREVWDLMVSAFTEIAGACPTVRLALEYKPMEPRMRSLPNSAAQSLLMALETELPNVGVTIDFGHAVVGRENASQSATMLNARDKLYHIHFNDNYGDWDWDMAAGVNNWWQLVEFAYWLKRVGYDGWCVVDIFPYRDGASELTALSVKAFRKAATIAESIDETVLQRGFDRRSALDVYNLLLE